jgi:Rab GDP dissociation inhibitor
MFSKAKGVIHKVPATASEALKSDLMGLLEKNRCKKFFQFIQDYEFENPKTQNGLSPDVPFKDIIKKFGLEPNTVDFVGHAVALYTNDDFLDKKSRTTIEKMQLYFNSFGRYGNSPFIYPVWGLSGLAEGFSRLCALYGGTYMLNRDIEEILYDENGNFRGIKSQGEEAYGKILITEPSYVQKWNKVKSIGKVIRRICILDHAIPKTNDVASCQIILPQKQINRKNDIFIAVLNFTHCVCKKGYYLAIISTMVETENPTAEIQPAMDVIGPVLETFDKVSDIYHPVDTSFKGNVYITSSFDPQSHFENDTDNVIDIYEKITGAKLDLNIEEEGENKQ